MATFNFAQQTYQPGSHTIGPFVMPSNVSKLVIDFTVASPDINDPQETLDYEMDCSPDGGTTWQFDNGFGGWKGGQLNKLGQPVQPHIEVDGLEHLWGEQCRIIITNTKTLTTAITVTAT